MAAFGDELGYWRDRLHAVDPDRSRLRRATRATVSSAAALAVLASPLFQRAERQTAFLSVVVAANVSVLPTDATPDARLRTALFLPWVAALGFALGAVVPTGALVSALAIGLLVFFIVLARNLGARANAFGMMAYWGFFLARFVHATAVQVPAVTVGIAVAGAVSVVVRLVTPEPPELVLDSCVRAVRRSLACLLEGTARSLSGLGSPTRLKRDLAAVNVAALAVEDAVSAVSSDTRAIRSSVFAAEVSANRLVDAVTVLEDDDVVPPSRRRALAPALRAVRRAVRTPSARATANAQRSIEAATAGDPELARMRRVTCAILDVAAGGEQRLAYDIPETELPPVPPTPPADSRNVLLQAPLAVMLGLAFGEAVAPGRGYWAVAAAFVVFMRAGSSGVVMARVWQRIAGTAIGVGVGLVAAQLLRGYETLEVMTSFVALFVAYFALKQNIAVFAMAFSLLLALVYSLSGRPPPILGYRLLETLVGGGVAIAVAKLILPTRPDREIARRGALVLRAIADFVETVVAPDASPALSMQSMRILDRQLGQLREVTDGVASTRLFGMRPEVASVATAIASTAFAVRPLAQTATGLRTVPVMASEVITRARVLASDLGGGHSRESAADVRASAEADTAGAPEAMPAPNLRRTSYWLSRALGSLALLERTLLAREDVGDGHEPTKRLTSSWRGAP